MTSSTVRQKVILITGGSSGIGLCCATELASQGHRVITASRTSPHPPLLPKVAHRVLDLASRVSVQALVDTWTYGPVDSLILNAGSIERGKPSFDSNGIEKTFAINYLNQALLYFLLQDRGLLKDQCRVIFLTTALHDPKNPVSMPPHWTNPEDVARALDPKMQSPMVRYPTAKLAVIFFVYALHSRGNSFGHNVEVAPFEPGYTPGRGSKLARNQGAVAAWATDALAPILAFVTRRMGVVVSTPLASGHRMAELALGFGHFHHTDIAGKYVLLDKVRESSQESYDVVKREALWNWTVKELGVEQHV